MQLASFNRANRDCKPDRPKGIAAAPRALRLVLLRKACLKAECMIGLPANPLESTLNGSFRLVIMSPPLKRKAGCASPPFPRSGEGSGLHRSGGFLGGSQPSGLLRRLRVLGPGAQGSGSLVRVTEDANI
jgi:hypothetical protein